MVKESLGNIIREINGYNHWIPYKDVEMCCQLTVDRSLRQSVWSSMEDSIINSLKFGLSVNVNSILVQSI